MGRRAGHYVPRTANLICEQIALGKSLKQALEIVGYLAPKQATIWRWLDEHPDFREKYERARQMQADSVADEMLELKDAVLRNPKAASGFKVGADILKWQAEVRNRARYGSKSEEKAKPPMDPTKLREEIKRLQKELGVMEDPAGPLPEGVVPIKKAS